MKASPSNESENPALRILDDALAIQDLGERAVFLSQACGSDLELRREVEELIAANAEAGQFLPDHPGTNSSNAALLAVAKGLDNSPASPSLPVAEDLGQLIGRYKLLQGLGEGGCGSVYLAEQQEPVKRKVALKVIKLGMDTKRVVARFEAERQAPLLLN